MNLQKGLHWHAEKLQSYTEGLEQTEVKAETHSGTKNVVGC